MSQRWRITVARGPEAATIGHRDLAAAWEGIGERAREAALEHTAAASARADDDNPPARQADPGDPLRARVQFAAPLPTGMTADAELVDLLIPGRLTRPRLRAIVEAALPPGVRFVDAHDVWIAGASLPALVTAADVRAEVTGADAVAIRAAIDALLATRDVPRPGRDPGRSASNLRPLIESMSVVPGGADPPCTTLLLRLRLDPALGSGRPEEVVEALAAFGPALTLLAVHRLGFRLREEARAVPPAAASSGRQTRLRPVRRART